MLGRELEDDEGWMFGGVEEEPDRRRLEKALKAVQQEMLRKGGEPVLRARSAVGR